MAEIGYLSPVPWLVAGDRNSANLSPVPPLAELIEMVQYTYLRVINRVSQELT